MQYVASAILLSSVAFSVSAAAPNEAKLKCVNGQIPVMENNEWGCGDPTIQSPTNAGAGLSSSRQTLSKAPTKPSLRGKPDLSIANIVKLNDATPNVDSFKVYVKNSQNVASPANKMFLSSTSGSGDVNVGPIPANSGNWITVKFFEFEGGSRISLKVDSHKKVAETNENNNTYAFNW